MAKNTNEENFSFKTTIKLGDTEAEISITSESLPMMLHHLAFIESLPKVGPDGEKDLKLISRVAGEDKHHYLMLRSDKANKEMVLHNFKALPGAMYVTNEWKTIYGRDNRNESPASTDDLASLLSGEVSHTTKLEKSNMTAASSPSDQEELLKQFGM